MLVIFFGLSFTPAATRGVIRKGSRTNIACRKLTDVSSDKYFRRIYFLKQQTKSRNEKETKSQRKWECTVKRGREREK